jgi:hypothetical protein
MVAMLGTLRERINSQSVSVLSASTSRSWVAAGSDVLCFAPNARTLNSPPFCTCFDSGPSRHDNANGSALLWYCPSFLCVISHTVMFLHVSLAAVPAQMQPPSKPKPQKPAAAAAAGPSAQKVGIRAELACPLFACRCVVQLPMQLSKKGAAVNQLGTLQLLPCVLL